MTTPASTQTGSGSADVFAELRGLSERWPEALVKVAPLEFDLDHEPEPPSYLVDRLLERQTVNILSGDTGAGKSLVIASLVVAICTDRGVWLTRETYARRVLVIDEENPSRLVRERLRALGLRNEHRDRLRYFNRQGFNIGAPEWTERLRVVAKDHRADLIVIDTAAAATIADVNDNDAVARLYSHALRPIATELDAAVLVLHHERKRQQGQTSDPGQAMMGARQWAGQADTHISLRIVTPLTETIAAGGNRHLQCEFVMRTPKVRDGEPDISRLIVVKSEKDTRGRLLSMSVTDAGRYEREPSKQDALAERITVLLRERGAMKHSAISVALDTAGGTLVRALQFAVADGTIVQDEARGPYRAADNQPNL